MIPLAQTRLPSLAAFQRTEIAFARQVLESERLSCGEAHFHPRHPEFGASCFVTDFDCDAAGVAESLRIVDATYASLGGRCSRVYAALGAAAEILDPYMQALGFIRRDRKAFVRPGSANLLNPKGQLANENVRILAARAMPRAYRKLLGFQLEHASEAIRNVALSIAIDRLDDPQYEPWVALCGDEPVGTAAFHTVGDVGAIHELFVIPNRRRNGLATILLQRIIQIAQRWHLEAIYAGLDAHDAIGESFIRKCGFDEVGTIAAWSRV